MQGRQTFRRNIRSLIIMAFSVACIAALSACQDDEVCEELTANDLRIGFYAGNDEGEEAWGTVDSLRVFAVEKPGKPVYDHLENVSVLELPLNPAADETTFVIDFFHAKDTLSVWYVRETHMISVDCGFTMFFRLTGVSCTSNHLLRVETTNDHVTNTLDEHLKAFIPPDSDAD